MTDYYKILSLKFGASDTEIKKQYRKLALIHHPDKNGGSKKSDEKFKAIVNAYQTLSNKQSRTVYDLQYKQHFQRPNFEQNNQYRKDDRREYSKHASPINKDYQETKHTKSNYSFFWVILLILVIIYFFSFNKSTTTGNQKADEQLEQQNTQERPESGELDF